MHRTYSVLSVLQKCHLNHGVVSKLHSHIPKLQTASSGGGSVKFKSHLNIDNLYPSSNKDFLQRPDDGAEDKNIKQTSSSAEEFSGYIPIEQLTVTASKSSGPGGQHVNKVNSKVEVRFHLQSATWIPEWIKARLAEQQHTKLTKDGYLVVRSDYTRKQMLNQADCMNKLRTLIYQASSLPREPSKEEVKLKEDRLARAKAGILSGKRHRSLIKRSRSDPGL